MIPSMQQTTDELQSLVQGLQILEQAIEQATSGKIPVKILSTPEIAKFGLPTYGSALASGVDLRAASSLTLAPLSRAVVSTGIFLELPFNLEAQVRSRSGLAAKQGLFVLNSPGTVDADYRGEIKVILFNTSQETVQINEGDRIAQLVFAPVTRVDLEKVDQLGTTQRADGGFGSTGVK
jgi:dUTP pyrophosphatase